ncbi:MAG: hypothetical protein ACXVPN_03955 [Bacteroidia bacterium]
MNYKAIISVIVFGLMISSCKKDAQIIAPVAKQNTSTASTSYINLQVGNYWVYNKYTSDTTGVETFSNKTDSVYIKKDTIIGSVTYYLLLHTDTSGLAPYLPMANDWITDSLGYIVSLYHHKYLDPVHINDTIRVDTTSYGIILFTIPMAFSNDTVPAGYFSGVSMNVRMRYVLPNSFNGNPQFVEYSKYALGLGLCHHKSGFVGQPKSGFVWKLLRYHI